MKEKCKNCGHPSKACIPFLMTLSTKEMLEWCRMWKERFGWSNAALADRTNVPKGTIDRVFSQAKSESDTGVKLATVRPIICAITGCTIEELEACEGLHSGEMAALVKENQYLHADVARLKQEAVNQRTFLADQIKLKDRYIGILACVASIALAIIFIALTVDMFNPNIGFFWVN